MDLEDELLELEERIAWILLALLVIVPLSPTHGPKRSASASALPDGLEVMNNTTQCANTKLGLHLRRTMRSYCGVRQAWHSHLRGCHCVL